MRQHPVGADFDPDESVTLADMDSIATSVAKSVRESIAANVEAEAKRIEDDASGSAFRFVRADELRRTAAAIREGRL